MIYTPVSVCFAIPQNQNKKFQCHLNKKAVMTSIFRNVM